jgi:glutathione S-transferase
MNRYTLYYAPGVASFAVHWMLVELDVEFDVVRVDFAAGDQRRPEFLALNPMGRVPVLVADGVGYTEAAAILMILAERHPEARRAPPAGSPAHARWIERMVYLANNLSAPMRDWFYADRDGAPEDADGIRRLARRRIEAAWSRLDALLAAEGPYLLGATVTTADLLATMLMRWGRNMPRPATEWPNLEPYVRRMQARPAYRETCRREGLTGWLDEP